MSQWVIYNIIMNKHEGDDINYYNYSKVHKHIYLTNKQQLSQTCSYFGAYVIFFHEVFSMVPKTLFQWESTALTD